MPELDISPTPWTASDQWGDFGDGRKRHESDAPIGQVSRFSYSIKDANDFVVAHCTSPLVTMTAERSENNARLMAAAPRLYRALEAMTAACLIVDTARRDAETAAAIPEARAAMSAALGRPVPDPRPAIDPNRRT